MSQAQKSEVPTAVKVLIWVVGLPVGLFAVAFLISLVHVMTSPPETGQQRADRIKRACEREYRPDEEAVSRCQINLMVEEIQKRESQKADRARQAAGM